MIYDLIYIINLMRNKHSLKDRSIYIIILLLFLLSGIAGLIYQSSWSQQLSLVFGSTELAIAAVLSSYMAGLAFGAYLISKYINRIRKPALLYAIFEVLIALSALSIPWLLDIAKLAYSYFYTGSELSNISFSYAIIYVLGSFLVLFIPTTLMGATLPLLSKFIVSSNKNIGSKIGILYTINTTGACLGALLSAFIFLPNFGLNSTIYIAVAINFIIFVIGVVLFRNAEVEVFVNKPDHNMNLRNKWLLPLMLISGFVSLAYEVIWTRLLSQVLGGSVYSFGVMLFVFLFGISLGSAIGSWLCKKFHAVKVFSIAQISIGISFFVSFYFADFLTSFPIKHEFGSLSFILEGLGIGMLSLFPGALFLGLTFPLAIQICAINFQHSGLVAAKVYAWNTVGAIFGAIAAGFYLLPKLGLVYSVQLLFFLSLSIALASALKSKRAFILTGFSVLLLTSLLFIPLTPPFKLLRYTALGKHVQLGKVDFYKIGETSSVMLLDKGPEKILLSNGLPESSIQMQGSIESKFRLANWLSMLPVVAHPKAKDMLIIGFGAGLTVNATPESVEDINVVELEPAVIDANKKMANYRRADPLNNPRVKIYHNDARNALNNTPKKFDIIVSQPSHPWTAGAANLYTQEFFSLVKNHLYKDGKFIQWIGMRFVDIDLLKTLLATLNSEFNYVELYQPKANGGLVFLASKTPIVITKKSFNEIENRKQWSKLGINSWLDFRLAKLLDSQASKHLSMNSAVSTDYKNILKILSPKVLSNPLNSKSLAELINDYDPMIGLLDSNEILTVVNDLIRTKNFNRARFLVDKIKDRNHKVVLTSMIIDTVQKTNESRSKLMRLLNLDYTNDAILYYLISKNINRLTPNNIPPQLRKLLKNNPTAKKLLLGWNLLTQNKVQELKSMEPFLESIHREHPGYYLATRLKMGWRSLSNNEHDLRLAMILIDSSIANKKQIYLLLNRYKVSLKLKKYYHAIASIYELFNALKINQSHNRNALNKIASLIEVIEKRIDLGNQADQKLVQSIQQLKEYTQL